MRLRGIISVQIDNHYCQPIVGLDAVLPCIIVTPHVHMELGGLDYACAQSLAQKYIIGVDSEC